MLSHGCFLSSYKAFFQLHTWFFLSFEFTYNGCNFLFVFYVFFLWEASCYEYCIVSHDVSIYELPFRSWYCILEIILLELFFPIFLATSSSMMSLHSSYYSSSWIISQTVVTCSSEQVSTFFSCRWLYMIFPTSHMH